MHTLNLTKGNTLNLTKGHEASTKEKATFGLGWRGRGGSTLDLDSYVVVLNDSNKVIDFIYFGNKTAPGIKHNGDDTRGGGKGDAPNETINIKLSSLDPKATKLIIGAAIYSGANNLGQVDYAFCTMSDNSGNEIVRFKIDEQFAKARSFNAASVELVKGEWVFTALGDASQSDFHGVSANYSRGKIVGSGGNISSSAPQEERGIIGRLFGGLFN